jgi:signal recognition particle subunit SRP54
VVKDFVSAVGERALGQEVLTSITPGQQIIKIVYDEMTQLMGGEQSQLIVSRRPPSVYMLVGLQGAGKTTLSAKLAYMLKKSSGKKPLLAACDIYRPAAVKQLQVLGDQIGVQVFTAETDPVRIAAAAWEYARNEHFDPLIVDTAGRLHINEELMQELKEIKTRLRPHETLLVVDAMTGQDAVNVAEQFHGTLGLTGVALTKLDGDSRGGAALSVKAVTGCPIKFAGMGEKMDNLEIFYPERMASRILGMGDIVSLVEKAQANFDEKQAADMERKLREKEFNLEDFLQQMQQMRKMGPLEDLLGMLPGLGAQMKEIRGKVSEKDMDKMGAIIQSMTPAERRQPAIINGGRKRRIALGSGSRVQDVNRLLKQFEEMKKMMKKLTDMGMKKGTKHLLRNLPF